MMRDRLAEAIQLREEGRAKQDEAILKEARSHFTGIYSLIRFRLTRTKNNSGNLGRENNVLDCRCLCQNSD